MNKIPTEIPLNIAQLPVAPNGYPIPYFVGKIDGKIDFRVVAPDKMKRCVLENKCWVCGKIMSKFRSFVGGPITMVNRNSTEPPSHPECAHFAVTTCPHILNPNKKLREAGTEHLPKNESVMPHHPDVYGVYTTTHYTKTIHEGHLFFGMGEPISIEWYYRGSLATRQQVMDAIHKGTAKLSEGQSQTYKEQVDSAISDALVKLISFLPEEGNDHEEV